MKMAGEWTISFSNGIKEDYTITPAGDITGPDGSGGQLGVSDQQAEFPSSQGWYMWKSGSIWVYIQVSGSGLKVQRFSVDGDAVYRGTLGGYCCYGIGRRPDNCECLLHRYFT